MGKNSVLNVAKDLLSDSYEESLCKDIIRNSLLGLRKLPKSPSSRENRALLKNNVIISYSKKQRKFKEKEIKHITREKNDTEFPMGSIVWSRIFSCESWPAIIIKAFMCGQKETSSDKCWVFWFGDHKVSEVYISSVYDFQKHYRQYYNTKSTKKSYINGICEALRECWTRINESTDIIDKNSLLQWSLNEFLNWQKSDDQPNIDLVIPDWIDLILEKYAKVKNDPFRKFNSRDTEKNKSEWNPQDISFSSKDLCLACKCCFGPNEHPFFYGVLCHPCKDRLLNSLFMFDEDGFNTSCIICAQSGELFLCDQDECNKAYCYTCLKYSIGEERVNDIRRERIWLCFLCSDIENDSKLKARSEWREHLILMFQPKITTIPDRKVGIRVLSLFDGIGTGKLVLDELNIKIERYFASEIDADSLLVSKMRHSGNTVQWIGDVTGISFEMLQELGPIDLLIGGSPCNDFSIANPSRKGLSEDGTGVLFYEFYRILTSLREIQTPGRPLFWLFENVASMQKHCRSAISRFFNCYPALLDAKYFSAQRRPRLFWGNIPGMYWLIKLKQ